MSGQLSRLNLQSKEYTGNTVFPRNQNRGYFFIVMTGAAGSVRFGSGGGEVPLALNQHYEPWVAPTSEINVTTTGTFVVVTNAV
jgi:hypothetical protein